VPLQQGSIVWAEVPDQAGVNPKCRPLVIVTPTHEIDTSTEIVGVAATGIFSTPLDKNRIELPWKHGGHPKTGLYKPCVVVCNWLVVIDKSKIQGVGGTVPTGILEQIIAKLPST